MSRGNLVIVSMLSVGLVAMFFWTLALSDRQTRLSDGPVGGPDATTADFKRRLAELERGYDSLDLRVDSLASSVAGNGARVEKLAAAVSGGPPAAAGSVAGTGAALPEGETELRSAIEAVLEERDAAERRQRVERMARGMSRFLLADIETTDDQSERFVAVITTYLSGRDRVRQELEGRDGSDPAREEAYRQLAEVRDQELQGMFSAADFTKIQERLDRGRRFFNGRGGTGGGRGTRAPRGAGGNR